MVESTDYSEKSGNGAELPDWRAVLANYRSDLLPHRWQFLGGAGGFSGTLLWRIDSAMGELVLRRWPAEHPSAERLTWIHAVLGHAREKGFLPLAAPISTPAGETFVRHDGHLWELAFWLSGAADYRQAPGNAKLAAALTALARFHRAVETFPRPSQQRLGVSPGISSRIARMEFLQSGGLNQLRAAITPGDWPELAERAEKLCDLYARAADSVARHLQKVQSWVVPLQPCLRDVWHEHVLFLGDQVTGLIDYGAMRIESPAADVARLLGSLAGDDVASGSHGLLAYEQVRPLSTEEHRLMRAFDASAVLLGGLEWLDWIYLQGRKFENRAAVESRLDDLLSRLVCIC